MSYSLYEWRAHLVFETSLLNKLIVADYEGFPDDAPGDVELLAFSSVVTPGKSRRYIKCELGRPLLFYPESPQEPIRLARRFISFLECAVQSTGVQPPVIVEIKATSRGERLMLFHSAPYDECAGTYEPNAPVRLLLPKTSTFTLGYLDSPEREEKGAALSFKSRFDELPEAQRGWKLSTLKLGTDAEWLMKPLRFYLRLVPDSQRGILYMAFVSDRDGRFPTSGQPSTFSVACYIDEHSFPSPTEIPVSGFNGLAHLLFPVRSISCEKLHLVPGAPTTYRQASYRISGRLSESSDAAQTHVAFHVEPLVKIVNADPANQHEVVLKPETPNAPIWKFEVSGKGSLKLEGRRCIYTSPSNAGVVYDEMGKTLQAPALRTSLENPFWIDAIATGYLLYPLVSTFIVLNSTPTHYFNKKNVGGKLKLDFCYRSKTGEEITVEPDLTTWRVLTGDGRISPDGVFTPGITSRFSVISAIEQDPKRWYYAVIIVPIPMMTVDELVAL